MTIATATGSTTIETYTGIMFDILHPRLEDIDIRDIAHAGSQLCRFTGHTKFLYTVAHHELLGSYIVPKENALEFLLHDAAESYVNDMSRPLKHMTECGKHYRPLEDNIQKLIRIKYGLPEFQSPVIHEIDNTMLLAEKEQLMGKKEQLMGKNIWSESNKLEWLVSGVATQIEIYELRPRRVEKMFLERFYQLIYNKGE